MTNDLNATSLSKAGSGDVTIIELFQLLRKYMWQVAFVSLIVGVFVAVYLMHISPYYRATATLQISNQKNSLMSLSDSVPLQTNNSEEYMETQFQLILSRQFSERVVDELRLEQNEYFAYSVPSPISKIISRITGNPPKQVKLDRRSLVGKFQSQLKVEPIPNTELVKISFESISPQLAKVAANKVGDTYIEYLSELTQDKAQTTAQWLMTRMVDLEANLKESEQSLQTFREDNDIVDLRGVAGLVSNQLTSLTSKLLDAQSERSENEVLAKIIADAKGDTDVLIEIPQINNHNSIQESRSIQAQLERQASELAKRYGPKHPKRIALQAQLDAVKAESKLQIQRLVNGIEQQYRNQVAEEKAIEQRVEQAKRDYQRLSRLNTRFEQLEREVNTNRELYQTFLTRLREADAIADIEQDVYVRFIDRALTPSSQFKPRKTLTLIIVIIATVILLFTFFIIREMFKDTLASRDEIDRILKDPVLAVIPKMKGRYKIASVIKQKREPGFFEGINSLRTTLMFKHNSHPPKVIAITSSIPNEGKSTLAINLANSFGDMEKVLIIDADLRHPAIAAAFDLDKNRPGLSNLLAKTHQITDCIVRQEQSGVDILTSGICPSNPLAFLSMKRFEVLIKVLGNFYDRIIIEVPPVHSVSDAIVVSRVVDSVLYVVNAETTKRDQIIGGLERLHQVRAPVEGIVLNKSDEKVASTYYSNHSRQVKSNIISLPLRVKSTNRS